jgi:hypothetical protein
MDLIDRYLSAVGALLPRDQRDDITTELRDVLLNRREEKEAELGRSLTRAEDEALLKAFGHPIAVAGRYGPRQSLIGPDVYPLYVFVLRIVLAVIVGSGIVTGIVTGAVHPEEIGHAIGVALSIIWTGGFAALGVVTLVFAVIERSPAGRTLFTRWNPRDLPRPAKRPRCPHWYDHVAAIVAQVIFVLWWTGLVPITWQPYMPAGGEALHFAFAPIWQTLFWPVLGLSAVVILVHGLKLAGWSKRRFVHGLNLLLHVALIAVAGVALRGGPWAIVTGSGLPAARIAKVALGVNIGALATLNVMIIASAITIAVDLWRLYRPEPESR